MNWLEKLALSLQSSQQATLTPEMNAHPEPVLSDKIGEVILNDGTFAEIYKIRAKHFFNAQHVDPMVLLARLMVEVVKIDGKLLKPEDVAELELGDFNRIAVRLSELLVEGQKKPSC